MTFAVEQHFGPFENCHPLSVANYPGVYFLCCGTAIVYVGKTKNIAQRITQHVGIKNFDTVMVMRVPEELLRTIEMHWIHRLRPELNARISSTSERNTVSIRILPETKRMLDRAVVKTDTSLGRYIEKALRAQFRKDGIEDIPE